MGSYKEVKGDLLKMAKQFDVIAHGANCQTCMGSGIAGQIRRQFPEAFKIDAHDPRSPRQRLGDMSYVYISENCKLYNLYTQFMPGPNLDYSALELCLRKLAMITPKEYTIGLPQIGCGIGGADWTKVKEIIQRVLLDFDVTIVIFE